MVEVEPQIVSLYDSGDAWIGALSTGRLKDLWDKGDDYIKIVRPPEGSFPVITAMNVVKTTDKPDMAMHFVNFALGESAQNAFAINNLYAPTNKEVQIPDDFKYKDLLVRGEAFDNLYKMDVVKLSKVQAEWRERFDKMIH
jgi:putative spermidine/putrescine transport system substrate-binding protein